MKICSQCRTVYEDSEFTCPLDGMELEDARGFADKEGDPLIGTTIAERFRVTDRIGVGGMGTVYAAEQLGLARQAALKILKREMAWDPETVTRFHREAKAMSMLVHPNTVQVFDFGETPDGLLYLAMEKLEGEVLTRRIESPEPMHPVDVISVAQQVLGSLHEAHEKGIIHRDLKPDNIYLARVEGSEAPLVKVLDFGIAKMVGGDKAIDQLETQAGTVFGTPRYMSPEQAQGKSLDSRSDIYGVGVLLYHMLTGTPPFVDDDAVVVMAKHIKETPQRPSERVRDREIPFKLEAVILKALEKSPQRRFQDAAQFSEALEESLPEARLVTGEHIASSSSLGLRALMHLLVARPYAVAATIIGGFIGVSAFVLWGTFTMESTRASVETQTQVVSEDSALQPYLLKTVPAGAAVREGEELLGRTPVELEFDAVGQRREVTISLAGYVDRVVRLTPGAESRIIVLENQTTPEGVQPPPVARAAARPSDTPDAAAGAPDASERGAAEPPSPTPSGVDMNPPRRNVAMNRPARPPAPQPPPAPVMTEVAPAMVNSSPYRRLD